jgi:hypothetical protein
MSRFVVYISLKQKTGLSVKDNAFYHKNTN